MKISLLSCNISASKKGKRLMSNTVDGRLRNSSGWKSVSALLFLVIFSKDLTTRPPVVHAVML